ncbi:SDR family NAD(P)-dependent oxidoreductase [Nocardia crassostreae]|uniref:SDR family NAD(P)-dependent oxidoreductase n=1 Tax=Nocardia crassostreae TaxID=53428 RepID=UPI0008346F0E|nr:SDR family NAD(P)-dependent oxidoreductase [Nocardia crassostreae]
MSHSPFTSRTALVTGATSGLGFALARRLVDDGATVIVHAPDQDRGDAALEELVKDGAEPLRLRLVVADFSRTDEVVALAGELVRTVPELDLLVNNAAIRGPERRTRTADGHEITLQTNYLAPYVLTKALTPALAAARGRVVNVSSDLHRAGSIGWTDLDRKKGYYLPLPVYAQSKLALTMFTRSFAETHAGEIDAISVDPGNMKTGMLPFYGHVGRPAAEVASELAHLCDPAHAIAPGAYYSRLQPTAPAALVDNPSSRARLARLTARLTSLD